MTMSDDLRFAAPLHSCLPGEEPPLRLTHRLVSHCSACGTTRHRYTICRIDLDGEVNRSWNFQTLKHLYEFLTNYYEPAEDTLPLHPQCAYSVKKKEDAA
ncbi:MAG: hypothetical protein V3S55_09385 [Nitrospiraceae bacterium]